MFDYRFIESFSVCAKGFHAGTLSANLCAIAVGFVNSILIFRR